MSILEVKGLQKIYTTRFGGNKVEALRNVTFSVEEGEYVAIMGESGSGKTTLLNIIAALDKATSGRVLLDGKDIWADPKKIQEIRFRVGLVMQYPEYQLFDETVELDIGFGPKNMGMEPEKIKQAVARAAQFAGLSPELLSKSPFDLSGGQKRRAALAGVMAMEPDVLVLDEPAAGLDPGGRREILGRIREYQQESGANVIIVSHSMEDMALYCDRVLVMENGKLVMGGTPAEVFSRAEELIAVGLDVPQITRVARALREVGVDIGLDIYTVKFAAQRLLSGIGKV